MHINVRRAAYGNGCSTLSVLVISLTKNLPLRHHAAKGNTTSLLNPISGYRIRLSTLPRDEIRDQCASRGGCAEKKGRREIRGREKQSYSVPWRSEAERIPALTTDEWQVRARF